MKPIERTQKQLVEDALAAHDWNRDAAAKEIGIGRTTLWRWIKRFKLKRPAVSPRPATDDSPLPSQH